jgi:hypothetical protein
MVDERFWCVKVLASWRAGSTPERIKAHQTDEFISFPDLMRHAEIQIEAILPVGGFRLAGLLRSLSASRPSSETLIRTTRSLATPAGFGKNGRRMEIR